MQITIMNFKGGQGKTTIALNMAYELDFGIVANESYTVLKNHLDDEHLLITTDSIPSELDDVIYDFGGGINKHMIPIIKRSDVILIPFVAEQANIEVTIEAIKSVKELNKNIILVPNKIKEEDKVYEAVIGTLKEFSFDSFNICPLRSSAAMQNIFTEHRSISSMQKEGGLHSFSFRKINDDFNKLLNLIKLYM